MPRLRDAWRGSIKGKTIEPIKSDSSTNCADSGCAAAALVAHPDSGSSGADTFAIESARDGIASHELWPCGQVHGLRQTVQWRQLSGSELYALAGVGICRE